MKDVYQKVTILSCKTRPRSEVKIRKELLSAISCVVWVATSPASIMSYDEEEDVFIQKGKDEETFSLADANNANKIQERFSFPHELVFTKSKGRSTFCGCLLSP